MPVELLLLIASILVLVSVAVSRVSVNLGVPALLLFLGIGMLAGSEGPGDIYFDDPELAQSVGIFALTIIRFSGGLDTRWRDVRPVFWQAASLASLGVFATAVVLGLFASCVLGVPPLDGMLLGTIVSSTDAATVGSSIVELGVPPDSLVALISRADDFLVPSGGTVLQGGDTLLVLVNTNNLADVRRTLERRALNADDTSTPT